MATLDLSPFAAQLAALPDGEYTLNVEAARELGGRELIRIPLTLPITQSQHHTEQGQHELGTITLTMEPNTYKLATIISAALCTALATTAVISQSAHAHRVGLNQVPLWSQDDEWITFDASNRQRHF